MLLKAKAAEEQEVSPGQFPSSDSFTLLPVRLLSPPFFSFSPPLISSLLSSPSLPPPFLTKPLQSPLPSLLLSSHPLMLGGEKERDPNSDVVAVIKGGRDGENEGKTIRS